MGDPYDPVCATDGNVYSNRCYMSIQQCRRPNFPWRVIEMGACNSKKRKRSSTTAVASTTSNCDDIQCFSAYQPVCASDGKIYSNKCYLSIEMCRRPDFPWRTYHTHGACKSKRSAAMSSSGRSKTARTTSTRTTSCDQIECFDPYDPVCASDGNVYSNKCYMSIRMCE